MATKIFIVDDHYMVIAGIREILQNEKDVEWIGHAMTASACLAFLQQQQPDVMFMDINLPDTSGMDLCKEVKEKYPSVLIIGLSTFNQQPFIKTMMDNGASGYVLKNATQDELMEAISVVLEGKQYLSFEAGQTLSRTKNNNIVITRREKEVLGLIAEGMTNNEIATKLFLSSTTVDTHRKNLLAKLDVKNTAALVRIAIRQNLID
jgi:DNA-binding NarL/FixJ family response regulator